MRRIIINGAVFMFMARGEKLTKKDALPDNCIPDSRYVLSPRGKGWDVRYLAYAGSDWQAITGLPFPDESSAWLAAYEHNLSN